MNLIINYLDLLYFKLGFVHCDLHLGNILYDTKNDKLYLYDFDLSILNINNKISNNFVIDTVYNIKHFSKMLFKKEDTNKMLEILHIYDYYRLLFERILNFNFYNIKPSLNICGISFESFQNIYNEELNDNENMKAFYYEIYGIKNIKFCFNGEFNHFCQNIIIAIYIYYFLNPNSILYSDTKYNSSIIQLQNGNLNIQNNSITSKEVDIANFLVNMKKKKNNNTQMNLSNNSNNNIQMNNIKNSKKNSKKKFSLTSFLS
jgi:hypothetical protein